MPERQICLFGNEYWTKGLLIEQQQEQLVKAPLIQAFSDPKKLAKAIEKSGQEAVVLCQMEISYCSELLEALEKVKGLLLLFSCSQNSLTSALSFYDQVDTLAELSETLVAESRAAMKSLIQ